MLILAIIDPGSVNRHFASNTRVTYSTTMMQQTCTHILVSMPVSSQYSSSVSPRCEALRRPFGPVSCCSCCFEARRGAKFALGVAGCSGPFTPCFCSCQSAESKNFCSCSPSHTQVSPSGLVRVHQTYRSDVTIRQQPDYRVSDESCCKPITRFHEVLHFLSGCDNGWKDGDVLQIYGRFAYMPVAPWV